MTEEVKISSPLTNGQKRKLSIGSVDEEYEPTAEEHLGGSIDDESSILNDEDSRHSDEVDTLKKESELPLEELMVMYGFPNKEYLKFKEDSQESASDVESGNEMEDRIQIYDRDEWKKEISIGPEYQAEIPNLLDKPTEGDSSEKGTLLWRPDELASDEINKYLAKVYSKEELPVVDSNRDDEQALFQLHSSQYNVEQALQNMDPEKPSSFINTPMKPWTEEECQGFENGLKIYGKQFHLIQKNLVMSRTVNEVIQFYYLWKKTERYDIFIQYSRIGTKRYIFNPGQPLDMDRSSYVCSTGEHNTPEQEDESSDVQIEDIAKPQESPPCEALLP